MTSGCFSANFGSSIGIIIPDYPPCMRKICLLLALVLLLCASGRAQIVPSRLDSVTQALNQQFPGGHPYTLWRVERVRQQLEEAVLDQQPRRIPLLLDYLTRTVPDTVPTVQPREAISLLLAAGAYGPLLQRVLADKPAQMQRRYRQAPLARPNTLADIADFYTATHIEPLTAQTRKFNPEEAAFIRLLLEVLPRGGVSPALDSTIQRFQQQYPDSPYGYVLQGFQTQEQVKAKLRKWRVREAQEWQQQWERRRQQPWGGQSDQTYAGGMGHGVHFDGYLNAGGGFFTGSLGEAFRLRYNMFGIGTELGLGRVVLCLHSHYGEVGARRNFTYDGRPHVAGNYLSCGIAEISAGYRVLSGKRLALVPFVGLSTYDFRFLERVVTSGTLVESGVHIALQRPLTAGLNLDVYLGGREKELSWLLKVRTGVRAAEASLSPEVSGLAFYLNVGMAFRLTTGY